MMYDILKFIKTSVNVNIVYQRSDSRKLIPRENFAVILFYSSMR